ncbi:class I SAM-dependent methyltransferase [Eubacterium sp. An11]|uniref:class I SAM-dependent methyltransferase n=1 Tax=Eubacterium sp. An11 TaxID=1965542 RepID=UPI00269D0C99
MPEFASRSANMDRYIQDFLRRKPGGVIAELGCGLETTFYRNDNGHTRWYAVDLPDVMEYRKTLLLEPERQTYFAGDAFSDDWIRRIRIDVPDAPVLVTAGGLFHYFEEEKVLALMRMLQSFGNEEPYYRHIDKTGLKLSTKLSMNVSDRFCMVKMVHVK